MDYTNSEYCLKTCNHWSLFIRSNIQVLSPDWRPLFFHSGNVYELKGADACLWHVRFTRFPYLSSIVHSENVLGYGPIPSSHERVAGHRGTITCPVIENSSLCWTHLSRCLSILSTEDGNRYSSPNLFFSEYKTMDNAQKPNNPKYV